MGTINSSQDYDTLLSPGEGAKLVQTGGKTRKQENKISRDRETKKSRVLDSKNSTNHEVKKARKQGIKRKRVITDSDGQARRPVNLTMRDDIKFSLDVLAAKRRVRPWILIDEALQQYIDRENRKKSKT